MIISSAMVWLHRLRDWISCSLCIERLSTAFFKTSGDMSHGIVCSEEGTLFVSFDFFLLATITPNSVEARIATL